MAYLIENNNKPKNVTEIHYLLQQISKYFLRNKGCKIIGTEVNMGFSDCSHINPMKDYFKVSAYHKTIPDCIGLKCNNYNWNKDCKSIVIEAKSSLSDYKNGFFAYADYTYVIAPLNIIPLDKIPKGIGLIEVDLDSYKPITPFDFTDVKITKRPSNRHKDLNISSNYYLDLVYNVANRYSNVDIFNKNEILLYDFDDFTKEELKDKYNIINKREFKKKLKTLKIK